METENEKKYRMIEVVQATVEQMKLDDFADNPEGAKELFQCGCCGEIKELAGSMLYSEYQFCNECVLITEVSLVLDKIKEPEEMLKVFEEQRFENFYNAIFNSTDPSDN